MKTQEVPEFVNWLDEICEADDHFKEAEHIYIMLPQAGYSELIPYPFEQYEHKGKQIHVFLVNEGLEPTALIRQDLPGVDVVCKDKEE